MGTVNYFTSDYITLGVKPYNFEDFETDPEFMETLTAQLKEYGGTAAEAIGEYIGECYECDRQNIETELDRHSFQYYHISIKPGYYEGFTLDIEFNYPVALDGFEDRREANKEITEIGRFLTDCAGLGLVKCSPGWYTGYADYNETVKAIKAALKEMRQELRNTPTWRQYERGTR